MGHGTDKKLQAPLAVGIAYKHGNAELKAENKRFAAKILEVEYAGYDTYYQNRECPLWDDDLVLGVGK